MIASSTGSFRTSASIVSSLLMLKTLARGAAGSRLHNQWSVIGNRQSVFSILPSVFWPWGSGGCAVQGRHYHITKADPLSVAYLVFPRPFMVERGHLDRVGRDQWV